MSTLHVLDHPMIQHKLTLIRDKTTGPKEFRELVEEVAMFMAYEVTRDLPVRQIQVETPIGLAEAHVIAGKKLAVVPILRAGLGMVEGILRLIPAAKVGHIGLYRDPKTLEPVEYFCKLPTDIGDRDTVVVDPMLATGGSAVAAVNFLKNRGAESIKFVCLISAPEGVNAFQSAHPDVDIFTASVDKCLNEHAYIIPGLGDAGDRLYGTR